MIFPAISRLTEAGRDSEISFADLRLPAGRVIADNAGVDADRGGRGQPGHSRHHHWSRAGAGAGGGGGGPSLGDGNIRSGLDLSVNIHLLHWQGGPNYLTVFGCLCGLEDFLPSQLSGGSNNGALPSRGGSGGFSRSLGWPNVKVGSFPVNGHKLVPWSCRSDNPVKFCNCQLKDWIFLVR